MRVTIDGIRYDTAKAVEIASAHGHPSDLHWYHETLYRKRRGLRFFLHGSGGALSHYNKGYMLADRKYSRIIPLTLSEAELWALVMLPDHNLFATAERP